VGTVEAAEVLFGSGPVMGAMLAAAYSFSQELPLTDLSDFLQVVD